ncbi:NAD(P)-binding protein [Daldinia caldariorum]|uniref:NAD(P)-binding protein n=1 Tax=Daldinia caldariorum TaxID=326644 RepID=UPI002008550F|nr:NAD(P)-binding protein [Daldinia caldariorum]KAI1469071.1 NAD(P)-binding protein [Daldinia caldariorum]
MASSSVDPNQLFDVKGLVVVVSGGGSGIGTMMVNALESNGAIVYVIGRRRENLDNLAATAKHGNIRTIQGDITKKADLERAVTEIRSAVGYVNVVIANAGVPGPTMDGLPQNASLSEFRNHVFGWDTDSFNNTYATNTTGVFFTIAAFLELLDEGNKRGNWKQRSQVIAISSIGAYNRVPAAGFAYGSSKAGVVHMMKQLSTALVPYSIRSNVIAPGFYPSEMTEPLINTKKTTGWPKNVVPEERLGDPEDIAGTILFLVSKAGAYINGNVLVTDGGRLGVMPSAY